MCLCIRAHFLKIHPRQSNDIRWTPINYLLLMVWDTLVVKLWWSYASRINWNSFLMFHLISSHFYSIFHSVSCDLLVGHKISALRDFLKTEIEFNRKYWNGILFQETLSSLWVGKNGCEICSAHKVIKLYLFSRIIIKKV